MAYCVEQYLRRHAEPEIAAADGVRECWDEVLIVPVRDEDPEFAQGLLPRTRSGARVLAIVVVNDTVGRPGGHAGNADLLQRWHRLAVLRPSAAACGVHHGRIANLDVIAVDRSSPGREFPRGHGVGLARKIGCDLGLALWHAGVVRSPWLRLTDADATLGAEPTASGSEAVASVFPFWHEPSGEPWLDRAAALYELWLRYYVAGLRHARSPWAMQTLGSAMAVRADAYAAVRGVPVRAAGEDFHLLAKLAKLGPVVRTQAEPIRLRSRASTRVPFGTGPAVVRLRERLCEGRPISFYHPGVFDGVAAVCRGIERLAAGEAPTLDAALVSCEPVVLRAVTRLGLGTGVANALRGAPRGEARRRRAHEWFDALRTLRFVHALRDEGLGVVPWTEAVTRAAFCPVSILTAEDDIDPLRRALADAEPARVGL